MFLNVSNKGYIGTAQYTSGVYLVLFDTKAGAKGPLYVYAKQIRLRQCGHFMMGTMTISGHKIGVSGSCGSDGLPKDLPEGLDPERLHLVPQEVADHYWHDNVNSEKPLWDWARVNLDTIRHLKPKKKETKVKEDDIMHGIAQVMCKRCSNIVRGFPS